MEPTDAVFHTTPANQGMCCEGATDDDALARGIISDEVYYAMRQKPLWSKWTLEQDNKKNV